VKNGETGRLGEDMAASALEAEGYEILARNYRAMRCEIDIIARDGETLVFAEVKARRSAAFGAPREAVTLAKQRNIIKAAQCYIMNKIGRETAARFDVVEVDVANARATHIKNAFELS